MDSEPDLAAKIERLQRDVFWTKTVAAVLFACLATASIANWLRQPKKLVAEEFVLKDRAGNIVARLGQYGFGDTCFTLTAKQGVSVASLCVQNEEGASLDLHNLKSESRVLLTPGLIQHEPMSRLQPAFVMSQQGQIIYRVPPHAIKGEPF